MIADLESWRDLGSAPPEPRVVLSLWRGLILARPPEPPPPTVAAIQAAVCAHYGLSHAELISDRRSRYVARPRQVAMWLCKQLTVRSFPDLGQRFGDRDHTTILYGVRRIEELRAEEPKLAQDIDALLSRLLRSAA